jgi:hypothetical protein
MLAITVVASSDPFRVKLDIIFPSIGRSPSAKRKATQAHPKALAVGVQYEKGIRRAIRRDGGTANRD